LGKKACQEQIITDSSEKMKIGNQRAKKHKMKHSGTELGNLKRSLKRLHV
jgi:hypothetical protein